jgi:hypothetical protein
MLITTSGQRVDGPFLLTLDLLSEGPGTSADARRLYGYLYARIDGQLRPIGQWTSYLRTLYFSRDCIGARRTIRKRHRRL